jgi:hypothetical protein
MKVRLIHLLLLFISCNFSAQEKYCNCEKFESLVDCKKHIFSNAASIHWEYNCEKGKIIFENKKVKKKTKIKIFKCLKNFLLYIYLVIKIMQKYEM